MFQPFLRFYLYSGVGVCQVGGRGGVSTLLEILLNGRAVVSENDLFLDEFQPFLRFYTPFAEVARVIIDDVRFNPS